MAEVRTALRPLIARLRREVGDSGPDSVLTDEDVADALEEYAQVVRYAPLRPLVTRLPSGAVEYLDFESGLCWWETSPTIVDGSWDAVTSESFDWQNGRVAFAAHQSSALYISGRVHDLYRAAENAIDQMVSALRRRAVDIADAQGAIKRNQQVATLLEMKRSVQAKQTPGTGRMVRHDV